MTVQITHNTADQQYEIRVDGQLAGLTVAREDGDVVVFPHTEVDEAYEGQGLAAQLVTFALDDVRARGKAVVATCPYVKRFIAKHAEYQDLLAG